MLNINNEHFFWKVMDRLAYQIKTDFGKVGHRELSWVEYDVRTRIKGDTRTIFVMNGAVTSFGLPQYGFKVKGDDSPSDHQTSGDLYRCREDGCNNLIGRTGKRGRPAKSCQVCRDKKSTKAASSL